MVAATKRIPIPCLIGLLLLLCVSFPVRSQTITRAEYFFDADPGVGKGRPLAVTPGAEISATAEIATTGLSPGFHHLFVRIRDAGGVWSMTEGRPFLLEAPAATPPGLTIVAAEYFFDTDPGAGKGKPLAVGARGEEVSVTADIPTGNLAAGFHTLYTRFQNSAGSWGMTEGRPFYIDARSGTLATIVAAEYFFDNKDPGPGKATPLAVEKTRNLEVIRDIPTTGLRTGDHTLHLRMRDSQGRWSYTEIRDFTLAVPRLDTITPAVGGNVGDVTVSILGASFDDGTKVRFTHPNLPEISVPDTSMAILNGEQIETTLDLRGRAVGTYDVEVTLANGTTLILPEAFEVEEGTLADPWADIVGFDRIRPGQWQTYTVVYGNRGNVDATGVPLWIQLPAKSDYKLNFELYQPESELIGWDSVPQYILVDTIHGNPESAKLVPLIIPSIRPGEIGTLNFQLRVDGDVSVNLAAWASRPMYQSPLNSDVIDCFADVTLAVANLIPGAGCALSILDIGIRPLLKVAVAGNGGLFSGDSGLYDKNGQQKAGSLVTSVALAAAGCIPGGLFIGNIGKVVGTMAKVGLLKSGADVPFSCIPPFYPPNPKKNRPVRPIRSFDPNDKLGLDGVGPQKYIMGHEVFPYLIRFENKASATAAAQTVRIVDTLDTQLLDLSTLELGFFSFDDVIVNVPPGRKNYTADVDLRPKQNLIVRISATLDEETGILTWLYSSLDPETMEPTLNPVAGFLPPNKSAPAGEGGVFFTVKPKDELVTEMTVSNKAYIYFDNNEVIPTPVWTNVVDKSPPESEVLPLPVEQTNENFVVRWTGDDAGAGVSTYSIYAAVNNGPYNLWLRDVRTTSEVFEGKVDSTYRFYSVATDSAGYTEAHPTQADASTTIVLQTSTRDDLDRQVTVYPNPARHTLYVSLPDRLNNSQLLLTDLQGREMMQHRATAPLNDLDVADLPAGMYFLQIVHEHLVITRTVVLE